MGMKASCSFSPEAPQLLFMTWVTTRTSKPGLSSGPHARVNALESPRLKQAVQQLQVMGGPPRPVKFGLSQIGVRRVWKL